MKKILKVTAGVYLPIEMILAVDAFAESKDASRNEIFLQAIATFLDAKAPNWRKEQP